MKPNWLSWQGRSEYSELSLLSSFVGIHLPYPKVVSWAWRVQSRKSYGPQYKDNKSEDLSHTILTAGLPYLRRPTSLYQYRVGGCRSNQGRTIPLVDEHPSQGGSAIRHPPSGSAGSTNAFMLGVVVSPEAMATASWRAPHNVDEPQAVHVDRQKDLAYKRQ